MKLLRCHYSRFMEGSHSSRLMVKQNRNLCIFLKCIFSMRSSFKTHKSILMSHRYQGLKVIYYIWDISTTNISDSYFWKGGFSFKVTLPQIKHECSGTQQWNSEIQSSSDDGFRYFLVNRLNKMFSISWKIPKPL